MSHLGAWVAPLHHGLSRALGGARGKKSKGGGAHGSNVIGHGQNEFARVQASKARPPVRSITSESTVLRMRTHSML